MSTGITLYADARGAGYAVPVIVVPPVLARNAMEAWGRDGERWLADLPVLLAQVARRWGLELGEPYGLSFHWVCRARRADGSAAVLKLGPAADGHLAGPDGIVLDPDHNYFVVLRVEYER